MIDYSGSLLLLVQYIHKFAAGLRGGTSYTSVKCPGGHFTRGNILHSDTGILVTGMLVPKTKPDRNFHDRAFQIDFCSASVMPRLVLPTPVIFHDVWQATPD